MNQIILAFLISAVLCLGEDSKKPTSKELGDLIQSLPTREEVVADVDIYRDSDLPVEKRREATERLRKAKEGFDHLRTLLLKDRSVFGYPGLLALARPIYNDAKKTYSILLGIPPPYNLHSQGINPEEFRVVFDGRGIITAIEIVYYR